MPVSLAWGLLFKVPANPALVSLAAPLSGAVLNKNACEASVTGVLSTPHALFIYPGWGRFLVTPTLPLAPPGLNCQVTTVAQAEQAVKAPAQQSVQRAFVRKRLVVNVVIGYI